MAPQAREIIEKRLTLWFTLFMVLLIGGMVAAAYFL